MSFIMPSGFRHPLVRDHDVASLAEVRRPWGAPKRMCARAFPTPIVGVWPTRYSPR